MVDCHYGWWFMLYGSLIVCGWTWAQFVFCLLVTLYQWLRMRKSPINRAMLSAGPLLVTHGNLHPCAVLHDWLVCTNDLCVCVCLCVCLCVCVCVCVCVC